MYECVCICIYIVYIWFASVHSPHNFLYSYVIVWSYKTYNKEFECLIQGSKLLIYENELLFLENKVLFRESKLLFLKNKLLFRENKLLFRENNYNYSVTTGFLTRENGLHNSIRLILLNLPFLKIPFRTLGLF